MKEKSWTGERLETFIQNENTIEHLHRYALTSKYIAGKRVLDIACGEGYGSYLMAKASGTITGVDIDHNTIKKAAEKYRLPNLRFKTGNAAGIPMEDGSCDVVVSFETLEHHDQHDEMMLEIRRVLTTDGTLIISTPEKRAYADERKYSNPFHVRELYAEEFMALLEKHFKYTFILYQRYVSGSLIFHRGKSGFGEFSGTYDAVRESEPKFMYMIALASNSQITLQPEHSIFNGDNMTDEAVRQAIVRVQNSRSYRLGNFLLRPFSLFSRK